MVLAFSHAIRHLLAPATHLERLHQFFLTLRVFFFCEKKNSALAAVDPLDRYSCCDHLTGAARAQLDGQTEREPLLTIGWPVWLLIAAIVSISLGALLLLLRSRISNRKLATRHAPVAPDTRTDRDTSRFVPPQPRQHRWTSASEPHASWFESAILTQVDISDAARWRLSSIGLDAFLLTACTYRDIARAAAHYALSIEQYAMLVKRTIRRRLHHPILADQLCFRCSWSTRRRCSSPTTMRTWSAPFHAASRCARPC